MADEKNLRDFLAGFRGTPGPPQDFGLFGRIRNRSVTEAELRDALATLVAAEPLSDEVASVDTMRRLHDLTKVMIGHAPRFGDLEEQRRLLIECVREADRIIGKPAWQA